jgi:hypothetical protein
MSKFSINLTGTQPLVMHNSRLVNPFDPFTKALKGLTSKRGKTEEDLLEIARTEFQGSLYYNDDLGPVIPRKLLFANIVEGAKFDKKGRDVPRSGLAFDQPEYKLDYDGPRDRDELFGDGSSQFCLYVEVGVQSSKVMRMRPVFNDWSLRYTVELDTSILSSDQFATAVQKGGKLVGLGDWRQLNGRFAADVTEL